MSKINMESMDSMHYDLLKELGNIGAGNATTALAQMLNKKLDMQVPRVDLVGFDKLPSAICGEEELVVGIYLMLSEDIDGSMMFLMPEESAHSLVDQLMGREPQEEHEPFSDMDFSALQEIGNIITGSYLSALSTLTKLTIGASVPYLAVDMAAAILSVPAIEFGKVGDKALLIETAFGDDITINGYFILIPAVDSYDKILTSLGL